MIGRAGKWRAGFRRRSLDPADRLSGRMAPDATRAWSAVWPVFFTTRIGVLLVGYVAVLGLGYGSSPQFRVSDHELINLPARHDAGWYMRIAADGYRWDPLGHGQQTPAFFPLYPALLRVVALAFSVPLSIDAGAPGMDARLLAAGTVLSLGAFLVALFYFHRLACLDLRVDQASTAVALIAVYPFAVFFSAAYTESLFLLTVVAAVYYFRRERWVAAGAWGLGAGLTRPNGWLLGAVLTLLAIGRLWPRAGRIAGFRARSIGDSSAPGESMAPIPWLAPLTAAAMPVVGLLAVCGFMWVRLGDPLAWLRAFRGWERGFNGPASLAFDLWTSLGRHGLWGYLAWTPIEAMNAAAALGSLAAMWPVARKFGVAYGAFIGSVVVPPLLFGGWQTVGRFSSVAFPLFVYLASVLPAASRPLAIAGFGLLQGLIAALFFTWHELF